MDSVGLSHREEGDPGSVYGFQWRHFGAEYKDANTDYTGQGVDQIVDVIDKLKNKPYDIILSAWNPADLKKIAVPQCHMFAQFYVSFPRASSTRMQSGKPRGMLHCLLYQRSCDMGPECPSTSPLMFYSRTRWPTCATSPQGRSHILWEMHTCIYIMSMHWKSSLSENHETSLSYIQRERGGSIDG